MIDPSSSEEESEEDQSTHHGGSAGGRAGSSSSHGSRRHPGSIGNGPGSGSVGSLASSLTASPGGPNHVGAPSTASTHGSGSRATMGPQETTGTGLDVPNLTSARNSLSPSMSAAQDASNYAQRPTSPSPSVASEKTEAELQVCEGHEYLSLPNIFLLAVFFLSLIYIIHIYNCTVVSHVVNSNDVGKFVTCCKSVTKMNFYNRISIKFTRAN